MTELEKLHTVADESQKIGAFLEWLGNQGIVLGCWRGDELYPERLSIEKLLASYFEIDFDQVEREKRAMLDARRARYRGTR